MNVIKKIWNKHYYAICFFAFILVYYFGFAGSINSWRVDSVSLAFHAVDFSMGFCSKILPGAIYNIFFDDVTILKVSIYEIVLIFVFLLLVCFFLEKVILNLSFEHRKTGILVIYFFITGPGNLSNYVTELGMLDVYWVFVLCAFIICISKSTLYLFIVPLSLLLVMIHYSSILCFVPLLAILILYKISCLNEKNERRLLIFTFFVTVILSISLTVYFVLFESRNMTYSLSDFNNILLSRGVEAEDLNYYEFGFYREAIGAENVEMSQSGLNYIFSVIKQQINSTITILKRAFWYSGYGLKALYVLVLLSPVIAFIFSCLIHFVKENKGNKLKVLSYICMMILPIVTLFFGLIYSTDMIRWISHSFMPLYISFIFVLNSEGFKAWGYVKEKFLCIPLPMFAIYGAFYTVSLFDPYGA